jgi:hypothetical protein
MILYLCVLIVFSLHRESLKLILATDPSLRWFCHMSDLEGEDIGDGDGDDGNHSPSDYLNLNQLW